MSVSTVVPAGMFPLRPTCTQTQLHQHNKSKCVCKCTRVSSVYVSGSHPLIAVGAEKASVMAFLDHDVGDARLVVLLKADTGLPDRQQLVVQHLERKELIVQHLEYKDLIVQHLEHKDLIVQHLDHKDLIVQHLG